LTNALTRRAALTFAGAALALSAGLSAAQEAPRVKFATTVGDFVVEVYPDKAPKTVENFLQYVRDKHYDGTVFHRVIDNFMVQGGGYDGNYVEKKTRPPVQHEGREALAKGLKNQVGYLAMARTNDPNSATAQFFINVKDNAFLDAANSRDGNGSAVFGKVVEGMDVVNAIKAVATTSKAGHQDVPSEDVIIEKAEIVE
jgi:cyclophilin family peptidyl-prolyl cis-trans isomerase